LLQTNGLLQTLAFLEVRARSRGHYERLFTHLAAQAGVSPSSFLDTAREAPLSRYVWLSRDLQRCLVWYKRFAESVLGVTSAEASDS